MTTAAAWTTETHFNSWKLPFDPRKGFHDYRTDYRPGAMSFYIDSKLDVRYTTGLPSGKIGLLVNT